MKKSPMKWLIAMGLARSPMAEAQLAPAAPAGPWQPHGIPGVAGTPPVIFMPATDEDGRACAPCHRVR